MLNLGFNGVCAMGILIGNIVLLPMLKKCMNDQQILIIGACFLGVSFISFGLIPYLRIIGFELTYIAGFFLTLAFISFPAANSIVTKYLHESEQGEGVGIVYAMRSITFIIAPIGFASLYHLGGYIGFKSLIFVIGTVMSLIAILVII